MGMSWGGRGAVLDDGRRDACLHSLGDHYAAGRLSLDDLDARIQLALAAETEEDLASVMSDLTEERPLEQGSAHGRGVRGDAPGRAVPRTAGRLVRRLLGFLSHWALTGRPAHGPVTDDLPAMLPAPPDLSDAGAGVLVTGPEVAASPAGASRTSGAGPVPRRVRANGGVVPTQRRR